jgi:pimeloyl-ACP methyl ester carboxylesterase
MGLTRRGHGRSDRPKSGYDLENFVEDIRGFLDAVGIERVILVGHSLAGYEMPLFAERYPQRVEAIVLLDAIYTKSETDVSGDPLTHFPKSNQPLMIFLHAIIIWLSAKNIVPAG